MGFLEDRFNQLGLSEKLQEVREGLDASDLDAEHRAHVDQIVGLTDEFLRNTDLELLDEKMLKDLSAQLVSLKAEIDSLAAGTGAAETVVTAAEALRSVWIPYSAFARSGDEGRFQPTRVYREQMEKLVEDLQAKRDEQAGAVTKFTESLNEQLKALRGSIDELTSKVGDQETRMTESLKNVTEQMSSFASDFTTKQAERDERFSDEIRSFQEAWEKGGQEAESKLAKALEDAEARVAESVSKTEAHEAKAETLLKSTAKKTKVEDYLTDADQERRSYVFWRATSVLLWLGVGAVPLLFSKALPEAESLSDVPVRLAILGAIGTAAAYAGRFASDHRRRSRHSRKIALDLKAIGPHLSELEDPELEKEIRAQFTPVFFGPEFESEGEAEPSLRHRLIEGVKETVNRRRKPPEG